MKASIFETQIRKLIKEQNISLDDFAIQIGISRSNLYKCFRRKSIESKNLEKAAEIFKVHPSFFFMDVIDTKNTTDHFDIDMESILNRKKEGKINLQVEYIGKNKISLQAEFKGDKYDLKHLMEDLMGLTDSLNKVQL